jgi:hypothetical protein
VYEWKWTWETIKLYSLLHLIRKCMTESEYERLSNFTPLHKIKVKEPWFYSCSKCTLLGFPVLWSFCVPDEGGISETRHAH